MLVPLIKNIPFFKQESEKASFEDLNFIAEKLTFAFFKEGENVMEIGEKGDTFYILLEGEV
jgi:CRP-like cAMP-binding protein